jgi:hypothetical protein
MAWCHGRRLRVRIGQERAAAKSRRIGRTERRAACLFLFVSVLGLLLLLRDRLGHVRWALRSGGRHLGQPLFNVRDHLLQESDSKPVIYVAQGEL